MIAVKKGVLNPTVSKEEEHERIGIAVPNISELLKELMLNTFKDEKYNRHTET